jgi:hypothetical protein
MLDDIAAVMFFLTIPFLLFVFWGPLAFRYATKVTIRHLSKGRDPGQTLVAAFWILMSIFMPVAVTSPGGNIPAIFPWWVAVLAALLPGPVGAEFSIGSFLPSVLVLPVAWFYVRREIRRSRESQERPNRTVETDAHKSGAGGSP